MSVGEILFSLRGRLNRKPYWIVGVVLLVLTLGANLALAVVSAQMVQTALLTDSPIAPAMNVATFGAIAVLVIVLYPSVAIMVKRFHDRDKSGKWVLLLLIPTLGKLATDLAGLTGRGLTLAEMGLDISNGAVPTYLEALQKQIAAEIRIRPAEFAVSAFNFVVALCFFVELGFFRGTRGPNRFGPDPLVAKVA
jgi:uncharacterized membrane protein YhaH (DUF805 family)